MVYSVAILDKKLIFCKYISIIKKLIIDNVIGYGKIELFGLQCELLGW